MKQLFTILFVTFFSIASTAQNLNFDAVERYFSITDSLMQDIPLSPSTWKELLSYKGIKLYLQNQGLDSVDIQIYTKNMECVYMPKNDSTLQARLKNRETYWITYLINNYKVEEEKLKSYFKEIQKNEKTYLDSVYSNCYAMLPKKMHHTAQNTTIYFIPLWNDAVAEDADVIFTLYGAYHFDKLRYGALGGHEIHHVLRKNKTISDPKDKFLYEALTLLLNEGSADLIDKKLTSKPDCPEDLAYYDYFMELGKEYLPKLDTAIMNHSLHSKLIDAADIQSIVPMSGHVPGCYMADIIERNGYKNALVKKVDDPINFIVLYNKAAKKDKEKPYVFSQETIKYVQKIKQKSSQ